MFVLGIDPGLSRCGYGVVERAGRRPRAVSAGVVRTDPALDVPRRLAALQAEVRSLIADHRPDVVAIERLLFQVNARSAIPVAQAAGVAMVEAVAGGCEVVEYSPNEVKQSIAGHGGADKREIERMVQALLGIATPLRPVDAADAVALALCHLAFAPMRRRTADAQAAAAQAAAARGRRSSSRISARQAGTVGAATGAGGVAGRVPASRSGDRRGTARRGTARRDAVPREVAR